MEHKFSHLVIYKDRKTHLVELHDLRRVRSVPSPTIASVSISLLCLMTENFSCHEVVEPKLILINKAQSKVILA